MTEIIKAENVRKTFDNRIWVLDGIDLVVQKGRFCFNRGRFGKRQINLVDDFRRHGQAHPRQSLF